MPLLLVHGIRLNRAAWTEVIDHLPKDRDVIAVDLPGHGVRRGERFSFEAASDVLCDEIDRAGGKAIVVGHSLGGYAAMALAGSAPDRVAGLVAAGATCVPTPGVTAPFLVAHRMLSALADGGEKVTACILCAALPRRTAEAVLDGGIATEAMPDVVAALRASRPIESLRAYSGPVLFVNGRYDHLRAEERRFLNAASHGSLAVVPRAGHYLPMTRPAVFARTLVEFTARLDARRCGMEGD